MLRIARFAVVASELRVRGSRLATTVLVAAWSLAATTPTSAQVDPAEGGTLVSGRVVQAGTQLPVPLALISVPGSEVRSFAASDGSFHLRVPPGADTLLVEQLGFAPARAVLSTMDGSPTGITVEVVPSSIDVEGLVVDVEAPRCDAGFASRRSVSGVTRVMEEARLNAERYRALVDLHPMALRYERTRRYLREDGEVAGERVDTLTHASTEPRWPYAPGSVLEESEEGGPLFHVPSLYDLAQRAFQAHHCFRYAGTLSFGERRLVSVEFLPAGDIEGSDVKGALFLDPATGLLQSARFRVTGLSDDLHVEDLRVDVSYHEIRPFLIVPSSLRTVQRLRDVSFRGQDVSTFEAEERLIDVHFSGSDPASPPGREPGPLPYPTGGDHEARARPSH